MRMQVPFLMSCDLIIAFPYLENYIYAGISQKMRCKGTTIL